MSVTKIKDKVQSEIDGKPSLDPHIAELNKDISALKDDFSRLASRIGEIAEFGTESVAESGKQYAEIAREKGTNASEAVKSRVRKQPFAAIALAAGAGALIAALNKK